MNPLIGSGYDLIGTRKGTGGATEFYNTQSGIGFRDPTDLANFVQTQYNPSANANNVFDLLKQGVPAPLAAPTPSPTDTLNQAQQAAFNQIKSSPVTDPNALKETASQAIGSNVSQVQTQIQEAQRKQDELLGQITGYLTQTPTEQKLTGDLNNLDASYRQGDNAIQDKVIPMEEITGERDSLSRQYQAQRQTLVAQLTSETTSRQQKLDAAKFLYDASRNTLPDTIQLMQSTAPDNIGSYTQDNGDMYVTMRNPITGQVTTQLVGNTGSNKQWEANLAEAKALGIPPNYQFYMKGNEIRNNITGQAYPTWEAYLAAGGKADLSNVYKADSRLPVKFETKEIAGQYVHIGYNAAGQVVSQEVLGDAGKPGTGSSGGSGGGGTITERKQASANSIITQTRQLFTAPAGYVGPVPLPSITAIRQKREEYFQAVGNTSGFDSQIGPYLTDGMRKQLGIGGYGSQQEDSLDEKLNALING
jgi:hypothetical protein